MVSKHPDIFNKYLSKNNVQYNTINQENVQYPIQNLKKVYLYGIKNKSFNNILFYFKQLELAKFSREIKKSPGKKHTIGYC